MKGIELNLPYEEKASRMEMVYRVGYAIVWYIVAVIYAFVIMFTWPLQVLSILIRGKRSWTLHRINMAYYNYLLEFYYYFYSETDERPRLIPDLGSIGQKKPGTKQ